MKIAVVGSRKYPSPNLVRAFVRGLPPDTVLVSGGALGVDSWAEDEARRLRLSRIIHEPVYPEKKNDRAGIVAALHARNFRIAEDCEGASIFWDLVSTGTPNVAAAMHKLGRSFTVYGPNGANVTDTLLTTIGARP